MTVTEDGLKKIKANPDTAALYEYPKPKPPAEEPEEVSNLKKKKEKPGSVQDGDKNEVQ